MLFHSSRKGRIVSRPGTKLSGEYTSYSFGKRCQEMGVMPSMGSVGDAYDNAMAESFFATLERELLNRRALQDSERSAHGRVRMDRGLVQPASPPLITRPHLTHQLRKETSHRTSCLNEGT
jgi:transposase InsO family protein